MRNILTLDVSKDEVVSLEQSDDGTNAIAIKFINCINCGANPRVEFYKKAEYIDSINFSEGSNTNDVEIPFDYISDGHILHFRYISDVIKHKYFHILGNASLYEDMRLTKLTSDVLEMQGTMPSNEELDYLSLLVELLTDMKKDPTEKNCYDVTKILFDKLASGLIENGNDISNCNTMEKLIDVCVPLLGNKDETEIVSSTSLASENDQSEEATISEVE